MAKNKKDIEEEILIDERMAEEEDYAEYVRMREEQEGIRSRRARIEEEEERRQEEKYEALRQKKEREQRDLEERKRRKGYERRKKTHPVRNFILTLLIILVAAAGGCLFYLRSQLQTVNAVELEDNLQSSICAQVQEDKAMKDYRNIALFGVDSREQDLLGGNNRSDSIMICSFPCGSSPFC